MRVDFLHRRVLSDVQALHRDISHIMPHMLPERHAQRATNIGAFVKRLNAITQLHGIRNLITDIRHNETPIVGRLRFCADWSPEELRPKTRQNEDITIHWLIHPNMRRVSFTQDTWTSMIFMYWGYVMHELVHRYQNINRDTENTCRVYRPAAKESDDYRLHEEQLYLGEYDEIEAHAHDIAFEMLALYPHLSFRDAMREIRHTNYASTVVASLVTYPIYREAFKNARNHPVMPALHRKIRTWYREIKQYHDVYDELTMFQLPRHL
jgi:hypothetical protein